MSRDRSSFFAYNWSGKHFNPMSCGVIRNQRSKIRRSNISSTTGCLFRKISKFDCRVIKHARDDTVTSIISCILYYIQNITILYTIKCILINQRCRRVPLLNFKIIILIATRLAGELVYRIPYRRTRAWPLGRVCARAKVSCIQRVSLLGAVIVNQIYHMFHIILIYVCNIYNEALITVLKMC